MSEHPAPTEVDPEKLFAQFGFSGDVRGGITILPGGSQPIYRAGDVILKHIGETSLENNHSPQLMVWIQSFFADLPEDGFRIPKPIATVDGRWITQEGWTASRFVEGQHATNEDIPACIAAFNAFHRALKPIGKHPLMNQNQTAWGKADRWCWGEPPASVQPELRELVGELYALRKPVAGLIPQLIHGDPSPANVLVAPGLPPAILDLSPHWGPPEFALAMFANFAGPRKGELSVLAYFCDVPHFDQLLLRAALRMLLVVSALDGVDHCESERRAAEMVIAYVEERGGSE